MEKNKPKKMGRPKVDNPANTQLPKVRVTQDKLDYYKRAAEASGSNFSQWVRDCLDKGAKKK